MILNTKLTIKLTKIINIYNRYSPTLEPSKISQRQLPQLFDVELYVISGMLDECV